MRTARFVLTHPRLLGLTAEEAVEKVGMEILRDTVDACPVDLGNLARSYGFQRTDTTGKRASGVVGTNVYYAPFVEFGHGEIRPVKGKVLRWESRGVVHFAQRVGPQPPQPHLGPAFDKARGRYR